MLRYRQNKLPIAPSLSVRTLIFLERLKETCRKFFKPQRAVFWKFPLKSKNDVGTINKIICKVVLTQHQA